MLELSNMLWNNLGEADGQEIALFLDFVVFCARSLPAGSRKMADYAFG